MTRIRCVVERITYQNPENGFSILKVRVKGYDDLIPLVGNLLDATVGSVLLAEGNWKVDVRYGRQFMAEKWEKTMPATLYGIEKYLGSGLIKGVGPKCAKQIVSVFGLNTIAVIEDSPRQTAGSSRHWEKASRHDSRELGASKRSQEYYAVSARLWGQYRIRRENL